jgi:hypothetical protein
VWVWVGGCGGGGGAVTEMISGEIREGSFKIGVGTAPVLPLKIKSEPLCS